MSDTKSKIVKGAIDVFSRYGVKRTTMGDIAESSNVSRQTLYAAFKSKDEIFAFATQAIGEDIIDQLQSEWKKTNELSSVLDIYFEHAVLRPFDTMQAMPDIRDLVNGVGNVTDSVIKKLEIEKAELLSKQLASYENTLKQNGSNPEALSNFVVSASGGFKFSAANREQLEELLATLKSTILAMVR